MAHTGTKTQLSAASAAQAGFRFKSSRRGRRVAESAGEAVSVHQEDGARDTEQKPAAELGGYGGCEDVSRWSCFSFAVCGGCPSRDHSQ